MVWAFPESGMVVLEVEQTIAVAAPEPFSALVVDEILLDILPASEGFVEYLH